MGQRLPARKGPTVDRRGAVAVSLWWAMLADALLLGQAAADELVSVAFGRGTLGAPDLVCVLLRCMHGGGKS